MGSTKPVRPPLSREVVADRAMAMADADGLEAVTIRRLATELGVTPMALYWHFRTKEDLLAGMADRVLDRAEVPTPSGDWERDLRGALVALVTAMRPFPQVAHLVAPRMFEHPRGLALTEVALASLSAAGFDPPTAGGLAMQAMRVAIGLVTEDAVDDSGADEAERDAQRRAKRARLAAMPPDRFPALVAHAEAMAFCDDADDFFDLGVEHYLAGVRGLAAGRAPRRRPRARASA